MKKIIASLFSAFPCFLSSFALAAAIGGILLWCAYVAMFKFSTQWWMTMMFSYGGLLLASYAAGRLTPLVIGAVSGRFRVFSGFLGLLAAAAALACAWHLFLNPNPLSLKAMLDMGKTTTLQALALILASGPLLLLFAGRRSLKKLRRNGQA